jgi:hypothetical protein
MTMTAPQMPLYCACICIRIWENEVTDLDLSPEKQIIDFYHTTLPMLNHVCLKPQCLHILYEYVLWHGRVSHIKMRSLWPWHFTTNSNNWFFYCTTFISFMYVLGYDGVSYIKMRSPWLWKLFLFLGPNEREPYVSFH